MRTAGRRSGGSIRAVTTSGLTDWTGYPDRPGHRLWDRAATPAGVRAAWRTSASSVGLEIRAALGIYTLIAPVDVLVDGELHAAMRGPRG